MQLHKYFSTGLFLLFSIIASSQQTRDEVLRNSATLVDIPSTAIDISTPTLYSGSENSTASKSLASTKNLTLSGSEAGATPGALSVSASGGANYTIPIAIPPGIGNVAPSVSLTFNSQAANGLAGWGWNISGVSTITRLPSTKYHDGEIDPVDFDNKDRYALDGQRLMLKTGTYGAANSEYQTENFSNIKIKAYGTHPSGAAYGPSYFIVYHPNGSRAWYGNASSSRGKLEWAIYKLQDPQGNFIQYSYSQSNGLLRINTISYGSRTGTSAPNVISFTYKNRKRIELSFVGGHSFKRTQILDKIEVHSGGSLFRKYQLTHSSTLRGRYERLWKVQETNGANKSFTPIVFNYGRDSSDDLLTPVYSSPAVISPGARSDLHGVVAGDYDADGKMDFATYKKDKQGEVNLHWRFFQGYNGSAPATLGRTYNFGKFDDIFTSTFMVYNSHENKHKVMPGQAFTIVSENNAGSGGTSEVRFRSYQVGGAAGLYDGGQKVWKAPNYVHYGDDNYGDPRTISFTSDISGAAVSRYKDFITANHRVYNNANVTYNVSEELTLKPGFHTAAGSTFHGKMDFRDRRKIPKEYITGDFNGDGIIDVLAIQKNYEVGLECHTVQDPYENYEEEECYPVEVSDPKVYFIDLNRAKTQNFVNLAGTLQSMLSSKYPTLSGDFDGDGKSDLFQFSQGNLKVYTLNKSNQLVLRANISDNYIKDKQPILLGDYNGDGKMDFSTPTAKNSSSWRFFFSTGTSFSKYNTGGPYYQEGYGTNNTGVSENGIAAPYVEYHYFAQDINADGKTDIIKHKVVTPYSATDRSYDHIMYYANTGIGSDGKVDFYSHNYIIRNQGNQKNGIPVFLDTNISGSNFEYGYIGVNNFFAYQFNADNQKDMQLNSISNNGLSQEITYSAVGGDDYFGAYTSGYDDGFPYMNIHSAPGLKLVSQIIENASGIERRQLFSYESATTHLEGLGFQGFRTVKRTNKYGTGVNQIWNISRHNPQERGSMELEWSSTSQSSYGDPTNYITKSIYTYTSSLSGNKVFNSIPTRIVTDNDLQGVSSTKTYTYDAYNNPLTINTTFPGGSNRETYTYYNNASVFDQNYHIGRVRAKVTSSTMYGNTFSNEEEFAYNNNLPTQIKKKGNNTDWLTETFSYDGFGNVISKTLAGQGVTSRTVGFEFDTSGRFLKKMTSIEGLETSYTYHPNGFGNIKTTTNPYNQTTEFTYDGWNRVTQTKDYLDKVTTTSYQSESGDNFVSIQTNYPDGRKQKTYVNRLGWEIKSSALSLNNKWVSQSMEHDAQGKATRVSEPYFSSASQWNVTGYDQYGRPTTTQLHTGKTITTTYSGLSTTVNDGTKSVTTTRDAAGNIAEVTDPGGTIAYTYYANGVMKSTNYDGHQIDVDIDGWGRKTRLHDPTAGVYTYSYNILGEVLEETTPKGTTTYTYDAYGKVTQKSIDGDNTKLQLSYVYDTSTKLLTGINGQDTFFNQSYTYGLTYDGYQRPKKITENTGMAQFEKSYTYDTYGRISEKKIISGSGGQTSTVHTKNLYDTAGIRHEVIDAASGGSLWKLTEETERGQALTVELGNGVVKTREYDTYGLVSKMQDTHGDTNAKAMHMTYTFNAARGTLTERKNHSFNWEESFSYDNLDRLTNISGAVTKTQTYDTRGRITNNSDVGSYTYQTGSTYQLKDIGLNTNGDQYYEEHAPQQISYNAFKKPIDIVEEGNGRVSFEYGPLTNRSHAWYGGLQEDKLQRRYHKQYSAITPVEIVHDTQDNSYKIITYVMGDEYTAPVAHIKKNGSNAINEYHYLHRDYLGSILAITNSAGEAVEKRQFGAWGTVDKFWAKNGTTNFGYESLLGRGYTGHEHFFSVGLIHMNGRMYDPQLGRFLSPDNYIQDPYNTQNFNRYGYVLNNPLMYIDPTGEMTDCTCSGSGWWIDGESIKQAWDNWGIKDWFNNAFSTFGTDLGKIGTAISKPFREIGRFFRRLFGGSSRRSGPTTIQIPTNTISIDGSMSSSPIVPPVMTSNGMNGGGVLTQRKPGTVPENLIDTEPIDRAFSKGFWLKKLWDQYGYIELGANTVKGKGFEVKLNKAYAVEISPNKQIPWSWSWNNRDNEATVIKGVENHPTSWEFAAGFETGIGYSLALNPDGTKQATIGVGREALTGEVVLDVVRKKSPQDSPFRHNSTFIGIDLTPGFALFYGVEGTFRIGFLID